MPLTDDSEFWPRVSRRMIAELRASRDNNTRFLWMDDLVPGTLSPQLDHKMVQALAFISEDSGKSFVHHRLTLHLGASAMEAWNCGDWPKLFPPADATGWLRVDRAGKMIDIDCL